MKKRPIPQRKRIVKIDLHGMTVRDAVDSFEETLNRAILDEDVAQIEVIHGIGTGKVREGIHQYLRKSRVISSFRLLDHNAGTTLVYL
ncbi:Smr/MutS family protein [bacterium]|nr:Smr/MutS family protein [bacterium]